MSILGSSQRTWIDWVLAKGPVNNISSGVIPGHTSQVTHKNKMNTCYLQERFASDSLFVDSYRTACRLFDVCDVLLLRVLEITPVQLLYLDPSEIQYQMIFTMMLFLQVYTVLLDDSWGTKCQRRAYINLHACKCNNAVWSFLFVCFFSRPHIDICGSSWHLKTSC